MIPDRWGGRCMRASQLKPGNWSGTVSELAVNRHPFKRGHAMMIRPRLRKYNPVGGNFSRRVR